MALLVIDNFDDGLAPWRHSTCPTPNASYGKTGKGIRVGDNSSTYLQVGLAAHTSSVTVTAGMNMKIVSSGAGSSDRSICGGFCNEVGKLYTYYFSMFGQDRLNDRWFIRDRWGLGYSDNGTCVVGAWYYVEFQTYFHNTLGWVKLFVDGELVASRTNVDTIYTGTQPWYFLTADWHQDSADALDIDDFYFLDDTGTENNAPLGPINVEMLLPNANGNSSGLTGSDGNQTDNYLLVDNNAAIPPASTEYVGASSEGAKDTYGMEDLAGSDDILGVQTTLFATKTDIGGKYVRPVIRRSGVDYTGPSRGLTLDSYVHSDEMFELDPSTSSLWLPAGVNAMELGPEVRDS